jgi:hypothetical protein
MHCWLDVTASYKNIFYLLFNYWKITSVLSLVSKKVIINMIIAICGKCGIQYGKKG